MDRFSIKHRLTTTYKPSTNGLVEKTNETLCRILAKEADLEGNRHNWDKKVHATLWAYRATVHALTKFSPFQLVYGIDPMLPIEYDVATIKTIEKKRLLVEESIS